MMDIETVETILELDGRLKKATREFHNSAAATRVHDPTLGHVFGELELSVSDVLFVAALSQVHVLLTGPSGVGKTALAELVCQGLFGREGWYLQKLNPNLTVDDFCDIETKEFQEHSLRKAVKPAPFLSLPCTILDEANRTPPALANVLLGFADGNIELRCGLKYRVGHAYRASNGEDARYHIVMASINEGREFAGSFPLDAALSRRFTLRVPFSEIPPTPHDALAMIEQRTGHAKGIDQPNAVEALARASDVAVLLPLDPVAVVYLLYLRNVGRCPHSKTGYHSPDGSQAECNRSECRIQKGADGFCPSVGGLCAGVLIFLKRAACGLAALRAARTAQAIAETCKQGNGVRCEQLVEFAECDGSGDELREAAISRYLQSVRVTVEDLKAMLPFVGLGGKVPIADGYIAKRFSGSEWLAMKGYVEETYGRLEDFFRQNQALFQQLGEDESAAAKLIQRAEHAERFSDPAILYAIVPLLERHRQTLRSPEEVAEEIAEKQPFQEIAAELTGSADS